ncbi:MAG TPA: TonB-dependent receptor plug domain-containing protein, partial [Flavitalea sp.]|nr:TonB-dependent receptor plug domain-containing protein [Flavitalea sp.]
MKRNILDFSDGIVMPKTKTLLSLLFTLLFFSNASFSQDTRITGRVVSPSGEGIAGASIKVKGSSVGTATDSTGFFSIVAPTSSTLEVSSVGFQNLDYALTGRDVVSITMAESTTRALNEVVVIGYGTANKRDLTGSISTVKAKDIADRPSSNPVALLQGKVPGLTVVNSGRPGAEPDIRIRGTNSINGVKPVYVVDGILNDNINFLNPADIETMEILKDPSSLAIFGVRGANGAIVITTKRAKAGQTFVNFNSSIGVKRVQDRIKVTNAAQFKELYNEQLANQGSAPFDYTLWNANTDWQDQIFQDALVSYNNISIRGGTDKNRFYMGLGYITEEGLIKHEQYKKYTLNFSDELRVTKGLRFGLTLNAYRASLPLERNVGAAVVSAPIAPIFNEETGLYHTLPSFQRAQVFNPLIDVEVKKN